MRWHNDTIQATRHVLLDAHRQKQVTDRNRRMWDAGLHRALSPLGVLGCLKEAEAAYLELTAKGSCPPGITACWDRDLDSDPGALGAPNGVIDLASARLLPPDEGCRHFVTCSLPDPYDPSARHQDVDQLLNHYPADMGEYLWGKPDRRILVLDGPPGRGKSTLLAAEAAALGTDYYAAVSVDAIRKPNRTGRNNGLAPELADLMAPVRVGSVAEIAGLDLDTERLKALSGGDVMSYRHPHAKTQSQGVPTATLLAMRNPPVAGAALPLGLADDGLASRIRINPTPPLKGRPDPTLATRFAAKDRDGTIRRQALVARLVQAAAAHPLPPTPPPEVKVAVDSAQLDEVGRAGMWLRQCLEPSRAGAVATKAI